MQRSDHSDKKPKQMIETAIEKRLIICCYFPQTKNEQIIKNSFKQAITHRKKCTNKSGVFRSFFLI